MVSEKDDAHRGAETVRVQGNGAPNSRTEYRLLRAVDECGVRSWEVEVLPVAVVPLDDVGRFPIFMVNLENDAMTVRLPNAMPPNQYSITDSCEHDASDP